MFSQTPQFDTHFSRLYFTVVVSLGGSAVQLFFPVFGRVLRW